MSVTVFEAPCPKPGQMAATLRRRLQTCEKRIIELVNWDTDYFYDESLSYEEIDQLKALLKKRQHILNKMCVYTDNEIKRLEVLNAMFIDAIRQMNQDLRNLHDGRMNMPDMEQYNDHPTWLDIMIYYDFYAENSVLKMPEDAYYGSQFDKMLELLCAEEGNLMYKGCYGLCRQLGDTFIEELCDGRPYERNPALQDLIKYHLYSVPDVLRMNKFTLEMNMKQSRTLAVS